MKSRVKFQLTFKGFRKKIALTKLSVAASFLNISPQIKNIKGLELIPSVEFVAVHGKYPYVIQREVSAS